MKRKTLSRLWAFCLLVGAVCVLLQSANWVLGGFGCDFLPDWAVRLAGIVQLASLPLIMITTVKLYSYDRDTQNDNKGA